MNNLALAALAGSSTVSGCATCFNLTKVDSETVGYAPMANHLPGIAFDPHNSNRFMVAWSQLTDTYTVTTYVKVGIIANDSISFGPLKTITTGTGWNTPLNIQVVFDPHVIDRVVIAQISSANPARRGVICTLYLNGSSVYSSHVTVVPGTPELASGDSISLSFSLDGSGNSYFVCVYGLYDNSIGAECIAMSGYYMSTTAQSPVFGAYSTVNTNYRDFVSIEFDPIEKNKFIIVLPYSNSTFHAYIGTLSTGSNTISLIVKLISFPTTTFATLNYWSRMPIDPINGGRFGIPYVASSDFSLRCKIVTVDYASSTLEVVEDRLVTPTQIISSGGTSFIWDRFIADKYYLLAITIADYNYNTYLNTSIIDTANVSTTKYSRTETNSTNKLRSNASNSNVLPDRIIYALVPDTPLELEVTLLKIS